MIEHMFEVEVGEEAWLEACAAGLDLIDEWQVAEVAPRLDDAEFAEVAAELEGRVPPSPDQVVVAGENEPITPHLIAQLAAVDASSLGEDARIGLAVCWSRVRNYADAMLGDAVAIQLAGTLPVGAAHDLVSLSPEDLVAAEVAAALRVSSAAAADIVFVAEMLARRLPATAAAVRSGAVSWIKASILANATGALSTAQAHAVEERVLPFAAGRTPGQHAAAVRRWVDRIDPAGAEQRRRQARADVRVAIRHTGAGIGELFARMPAEELDTVWMGADTWARRRKDAGDPRTLDQLRVAALTTWATSFLTHGDPTYCDTTCEPVVPTPQGEPGPAEPTAPPAGPPSRHGRPALVRLIWDLTSLLGVTDHCGELLDSGATLAPEAIREILTGSVRVRRMLIDPATGELLDLTPQHWTLSLPRPTPTDEPATGQARAGHPAPYELGLIIDTDLHTALTTGDVTALTDDRRQQVHAVTAALAEAPPDLRELLTDLLAADRTADELDNHPDAYPPRADLAEFIGWHDRHPTNPAAGQTSASAGDQDHLIPARGGGASIRDNLHSPTRRWHLLKTHASWLPMRLNRTIVWISPSGRRYDIEPYDYRLGP
jgi:hypothetical protein